MCIEFDTQWNIRYCVFIWNLIGEEDSCHVPGFYLGSFVWGEVDPKKCLEPLSDEKKIFWPSRGSGGVFHRKILKR